MFPSLRLSRLSFCLALAMLLPGLLWEGCSNPPPPQSGRPSPKVASAPAPSRPPAPNTLRVPEDYASIQAAIDAAEPGQIVSIRGGDYEEALRFKSGITLRGDSAANTLIHQPADAGPVFEAVNCATGFIERLQMFHNHLERTPRSYALRPSAVRVENSSLEFRDCVARNSASHGFHIVFGGHTIVENCQVSNNTGSGISILAGTTTTRLVGNRCEGNSANGIQLEWAGPSHIEGNTSRANRQDGIVVRHRSFGVYMTGNLCEANQKSGIVITEGAQVVAVRNTSRKNKQAGVWVYSSGTAPVVRDHTVSENGYSGIAIRDASGLFLNNRCEGNVNVGIYVYSATASPTLAGNLCTGSRFGIRIDKGAGGELRENVCENNTEDGMLITGRGTHPLLAGNLCRNNQSNGVYARDWCHVTVRGGTCERNQANGILLEDLGTRGRIEGGVQRYNGKSGIQVFRSAVGEIVDNRCLHNNIAGIAVYGFGSRARIEGNLCQENQGEGIGVSLQGSAEIRSNTCLANPWAGIGIQHEKTHVVAVDNTASGSLGGIGFLSGAAGRVEGNRLVENVSYGLRIHAATDLVEVGENHYAENGVSDVRYATDTAQPGYESQLMASYLEQRQFALLDRIAAWVREDSESRGSRGSYMDGFFSSLKRRIHPASAKYHQIHLSLLNEWTSVASDDYVVKRARAEAYHGIAWDWRGSGYANTVEPEGWEKFREYLSKSLTVIQELESHPRREVSLYVLKMDVALGLSMPDSVTEDAYETGAQLDPYCYSLHRTRVHTILPRWGGSPRAVVEVAERAAELTREELGDTYYASMADYTLFREMGRAYQALYKGFDWARIQRGYRDMLEAYPGSADRNRNRFCYMAYIHRDRALVKQLLNALGNRQINWSGSELDAVRAWAEGKASYPPPSK